MMLETARLILRRWCEEDAPIMISMGRDPLTMRHFPALQTREDTLEMIARHESHFDTYGFGAWAVARKDTGAFIGACGVKHLTWPHRFPSDVEIGWRFHPSSWGQGFAFEAAKASLEDAFTRIGLGLVTCFTVPANGPSWRLMERLRMVRRPDLDFDHPRVPDGHKLKRHIMYLAERPL